jgi:hypothetical protein
LLPAAVAALLVLGAASPVLAGDGKSALQLLPYDTSAIASVNVDRVKTTVVYADALKMVMGSTDIAAGVELMKKQAGFDIDKDVKTFVIGMPDGFDKSDDLIVIVEGTFDQAKLTEMALKAGKTEVEHKGVKYLTDSENEMLVLPDKLVIADPGLLTKVIDVHLAKARSVLANPAVMQLVSSGDTSLDAWMAMVVPTTIRGELAKQLGGTAIDGVMASVDVQNGLAARMLLTTPSKADATALSTTISGAVTQLKTDRTFQQLGLAGALNSVAVTQAKSTLELSFVLTATEFTILRQLLGAFI